MIMLCFYTFAEQHNKMLITRLNYKFIYFKEVMLRNSYFVISAGIGRTGVFMLMETSLCKMEVLEPIYPLEIVRAMRDQRGMLVQTPV